jgi:hypothetical protein
MRNRIFWFLFPPEERERLLLTPRVFGENGVGARRRSGFLVARFADRVSGGDVESLVKKLRREVRTVRPGNSPEIR